MGRLIDVDVLWEELGIIYEHQNGNVSWNDAILEIKKAPTIEERKTGTWIRTEKHYKDPEQEFYYYEERCSECGVERKIGWRDASYCPHCGARMEEGT